MFFVYIQKAKEQFASIRKELSKELSLFNIMENYMNLGVGMIVKIL
jgi:hypothetical protein